jgi:hypothetical protein
LKLILNDIILFILFRASLPLVGLPEPASQDGWRFLWGFRQIIIWGFGLPDCTFRSLILERPLAYPAPSVRVLPVKVVHHVWPYGHHVRSFLLRVHGGDDGRFLVDMILVGTILVFVYVLEMRTPAGCRLLVRVTHPGFVLINYIKVVHHGRRCVARLFS